MDCQVCLIPHHSSDCLDMRDCADTRNLDIYTRRGTSVDAEHKTNAPDFRSNASQFLVSELLRRNVKWF